MANGFDPTKASKKFQSGNIWTGGPKRHFGPNTQNYNAADVIKQLQGYGQDYGSAANYLEDLYSRSYNTDLGAARQIQEAAQKYFSGWEVDPLEDSYDQFKRREQLKHVRDWDPNVMFRGGGYDGYSDRANALMLKNYQKLQAGARATRFAEGLDDYIAGETSSLQQSLQSQMDQKRKGMLAEMNRRGLLRSGQRGLQEAQISADTASQFEQGRADIYKGAQEKAQKLFTDPALKGSQYEGQVQDIQNRIQDMKDRQADSRGAMFGGAAGMIGEGIGSYLGNKSPSTKTPAGGAQVAPGNATPAKAI